MKPFHVYLLRCADSSYYCGHTDNLDMRMQQHHSGDVGYTSTRKPVELVWQGEFETREGALAFEQQIKGWSRAKKEALMAGDWARIQTLAKSSSTVRPQPTTPVHPDPSIPVRPGASTPVSPDASTPVRPEPVEGHSRNPLLPVHSAAFGLSLPKDQAGFDKLSPNGEKASTSSARTEHSGSARTESGGSARTETGGSARTGHTPSAVLSVNAGSSSIKFAVYPVQGAGIGDALLSGAFEGLEPQGQARLSWTWQGRTQTQVLATTASDPFDTALQILQQRLTETPGLPELRAVAHRVVHGGEAFTRSVHVTPAVLNELERYNSLAPLHQPHNLAGIRAFAKAFPGLAQIACFDTAYHATVPALHSSFALPDSLRRQGVRRYGFHGLSYQFIMGELQQCSDRAPSRVLMAHLGNGASLCAAQGGRSVATTMGFSALDGLMMGTRSGNLDPGVLLYLMEQGWGHEQIEQLLYKQSGLLGVSGISADMRTLRQNDSEAARFAIDLFAHRIVREAGAMAACLQGLDVIAFSGGIGEHDAALRQHVGQQLGWLGVQIDAQRNLMAKGDASMAIHSASSAVEVWVIPTDEGRVAAREALALYGFPGQAGEGQVLCHPRA
jgi:acetate kinase